ncbi:MAG: amidohydrolase family protein, partial [Flavisolibacter sp.]
MAFRKLTSDIIFNGNRFLKEKVLIVKEDGTIEDIIPLNIAGNDIEVYENILSPGFINCHCHLELSHMKGLIPERTGLVDFVFKVVTERNHSEEDILQAIENAEREMIQNGIVAVGDICNNALTIPQKKKNQIYYYNFIEASGWLPELSEGRFNRALQLYNDFSTQLEGTNKNPQFAIPNFQTIIPHAPYSVSEDLWKKIQPYFKNKVVSIHNQETAFEDEFFLEGKGDFLRMYQLMKIDNKHHLPTQKSSLQSYFTKLSEASGVLLVHNTFTSQEDIDFIHKHLLSLSGNVYFCICINANLYIENTVPPIELFRKNNCPIVLGTDSLASNHSLSIINEIRTIRKHFPDIPLDEILKWGTSNGAQALNMGSKLGSFEKNKKP